MGGFIPEYFATALFAKNNNLLPSWSSSPFVFKALPTHDATRNRTGDDDDDATFHRPSPNETNTRTRIGGSRIVHSIIFIPFSNHLSPQTCNTGDKNICHLIINDIRLIDRHRLYGEGRKPNPQFAGEDGKLWVCQGCGYIYDGSLGKWAEEKRCPACGERRFALKVGLFVTRELTHCLKGKPPALFIQPSTP